MKKIIPLIIILMVLISSTPVISQEPPVDDLDVTATTQQQSPQEAFNSNPSADSLGDLPNPTIDDFRKLGTADNGVEMQGEYLDNNYNPEFAQEYFFTKQNDLSAASKAADQFLKEKFNAPGVSFPTITPGLKYSSDNPPTITGGANSLLSAGGIPAGTTAVSYDSAADIFVFDPRGMQLQGANMQMNEDGSITFNEPGKIVDPTTNTVISEIGKGSTLEIQKSDDGKLRATVHGETKGTWEDSTGSKNSFQVRVNGKLTVSPEVIAGQDASVDYQGKDISGDFVLTLEENKLVHASLLSDDSSLKDDFGTVNGRSAIDFYSDGNWKDVELFGGEAEFGNPVTGAAETKENYFKGECSISLSEGGELSSSTIGADSKYINKIDKIEVSPSEQPVSIYFGKKEPSEYNTILSNAKGPVVLLEKGQTIGYGKFNLETDGYKYTGLQDSSTITSRTEGTEESLNIDSKEDGDVASFIKKVKVGELSFADMEEVPTLPDGTKLNDLASKSYAISDQYKLSDGTEVNAEVEMAIKREDGAVSMSVDSNGERLLAEINKDPNAHVLLDKDLQIEMGEQDSFLKFEQGYGMKYIQRDNVVDYLSPETVQSEVFGQNMVLRVDMDNSELGLKQQLFGNSESLKEISAKVMASNRQEQNMAGYTYEAYWFAANVGEDEKAADINSDGKLDKEEIQKAISGIESSGSLSESEKSQLSEYKNRLGVIETFQRQRQENIEQINGLVDVTNKKYDDTIISLESMRDKETDSARRDIIDKEITTLKTEQRLLAARHLLDGGMPEESLNKLQSMKTKGAYPEDIRDDAKFVEGFAQLKKGDIAESSRVWDELKDTKYGNTIINYQADVQAKIFAGMSQKEAVQSQEHQAKLGELEEKYDAWYEKAKLIVEPQNWGVGMTYNEYLESSLDYELGGSNMQGYKDISEILKVQKPDGTRYTFDEIQGMNRDEFDQAASQAGITTDLGMHYVSVKRATFSPEAQISNLEFNGEPDSQEMADLYLISAQTKERYGYQGKSESKSDYENVIRYADPNSEAYKIAEEKLGGALYNIQLAADNPIVQTAVFTAGQVGATTLLTLGASAGLQAAAAGVKGTVAGARVAAATESISNLASESKVMQVAMNQWANTGKVSQFIVSAGVETTAGMYVPGADIVLDVIGGANLGHIMKESAETAARSTSSDVVESLMRQVPAGQRDDVAEAVERAVTKYGADPQQSGKIADEILTGLSTSNIPGVDRDGLVDAVLTSSTRNWDTSTTQVAARLEFERARASMDETMPRVEISAPRSTLFEDVPVIEEVGDKKYWKYWKGRVDPDTSAFIKSHEPGLVQLKGEFKDMTQDITADMRKTGLVDEGGFFIDESGKRILDLHGKEINVVSGRLKDDYKIEEKVFRAVQEGKFDKVGKPPDLETARKMIFDANPTEKFAMRDIAGTRITVDSIDSEKEVAALIEKRYAGRILGDKTKNYVDNPLGGYRSIHYVVLDDAGKPVELQIRTASQTQWADWSHDTLYKGKFKSDPVAQAYAKEVADTLHAKDIGKCPAPCNLPDCPQVLMAANICFG